MTTAKIQRNTELKQDR